MFFVIKLWFKNFYIYDFDILRLGHFFLYTFCWCIVTNFEIFFSIMVHIIMYLIFSFLWYVSFWTSSYVYCGINFPQSYKISRMPFSRISGRSISTLSCVPEKKYYIFYQRQNLKKIIIMRVVRTFMKFNVGVCDVE